MTLERRLAWLEAQANLLPEDAEGIRCPACALLLRADGAGLTLEQLRALPGQDLRRRYAAALAEPDPRDTPCPGCGHQRPPLTPLDVETLDPEAVWDLMESGRADVGHAALNGVGSTVLMRLYRAGLKRGQRGQPVQPAAA